MAAASEDEQKAIQALRDKLKEELNGEEYTKSDIFLLRFLRARDGNLEAAEKMIRASIAWRRENHTDTLLSEPLNEYCATNFPIQIDGIDRAGRPNDSLFFQFKIYCIQFYERMNAEIKRLEELRSVQRPTAPPITQYTVIYDYEGFSFRPILSLTVDKRMTQVMAMVEANYPETLASCIYINCPPAMSTVLSILKPFMSSKTFAVIKHFNSDKSIWQPAVLAEVDPTQVAPQYGGTKGTTPTPTATTTSGTALT